jgi:hypothetical protein
MATAALRGGDSLKEVQRWENLIQGQEAMQPRFSAIDVHQPLPLFLHFRLPGGKNIFGWTLKWNFLRTVEMLGSEKVLQEKQNIWWTGTVCSDNGLKKIKLCLKWIFSLMSFELYHIARNFLMWSASTAGSGSISPSRSGCQRYGPVPKCHGFGTLESLHHRPGPKAGRHFLNPCENKTSYGPQFHQITKGKNIISYRNERLVDPTESFKFLAKAK